MPAVKRSRKPGRPTRSQFVKKLLAGYGRRTYEALQAYIPHKEPRQFLYDLIDSYPSRGGKGFRPGLCMATCVAFGGTAEKALRCAVTLELFHNAFLVHDDVEDGSEFRRGKPTMHAEHGIGIAVNVGDAMNVLSLSPIMENISSLGPTLTRAIFEEIRHMVTESVEGQAIELGWVRDNETNLRDEDYLRMTLKKTCWYTCIHPCRIGALVASNGSIDPGIFNRFGYYMGAAFQIQDDILNLVAEVSKYGKEIGGDIWEGKRTLMLIHLLNSCTPSEKKRMSAFLATPRTGRAKDDVEWVFGSMERYGSIDYARSSSRRLAGAALREFFKAYGGLEDSEDKRMLQNIVLYMIERDL